MLMSTGGMNQQDVSPCILDGIFPVYIIPFAGAEFLCKVQNSSRKNIEIFIWVKYGMRFGKKSFIAVLKLCRIARGTASVDMRAARKSDLHPRIP